MPETLRNMGTFEKFFILERIYPRIIWVNFVLFHKELKEKN